MATIKKDLSLADTFRELQNLARSQASSPEVLPDVVPPPDAPDLGTTDTPPPDNIPSTSEDAMVSDEELTPIPKDPNKTYEGIDALNEPPLIPTEQEKKTWSKEMREFHDQAMQDGASPSVESQSPPVESQSPSGESPELSQKETALKDVGMIDLTGTGQKFEEMGKKPPTLSEQFLSLQELAERKRNKQYGTISFGQLHSFKDRAIATAMVMNESIAGGIDLPYDFVMGFVNQILHGTGLDKQIGTVKLGAVSEFFKTYGLVFSPEMKEQIELKHSHLVAMADFMGFSIAAAPYEAALGFRYMSRPVYTALRKRFPGEPSFEVALTKLYNKLPFLKKAEISPYASSTREALKSGLGEMGETLARSPFKTAGKDLFISAGTGLGYEFFKDLSDDDPWVTWIGSLGTAFTFGATIKTLEYGGSLTNSVIRNLSGVKGAGAEQRAAERLASLGGINFRNEIEELVRRVEDPKGENYFIIQEAWDEFSPAQKAGLFRNLFDLEKTILSYDTSLSRAGDKQLERLQNIIFKGFSTAGNNISSVKSRTFQERGESGLTHEYFKGGDLIGEVAFTREYFNMEMKYLESLIDARQLIGLNNYRTALKNLKPTRNKMASSELAKKETERVYTDLKKIKDDLWDINLDKEVSVMPIVDIWKELLRRRSRATDREQLKFSAPSEDRERLILELGEFKDGVWIPGIAEAENNGNISLQVLQDIRSRVLDELKNMHRRPNQTKQRIFNGVQETIMNVFKAEEAKIHLKKDNDTGEFTAEVENIKDIFKAISFSRMLHDKFQDGIMKEILGPTSKSQKGVEPKLTFETLLSPTSPDAKALNVGKLLEAVRLEQLPPDKIKRLAGILPEGEPQPAVTTITDALSSYLRHNFMHEFVSPDKTKLMNTEQAAKWVTAHRELLKLVPELRTDMKEAIVTGDILKLRTTKTKRAKEYLFNKDKNLLVLMLREEPENIFDWKSGSALIKDIPVTDLRQVNKVIKKLVLKANKDESGRAMLGLQQSVFQWLFKKGLITEKGGSVFSGAKLTSVLNEEKTKIIVSTILSEEQKARLRVLQITSINIDAIRTASPLVDKKGAAQSISGDTTGWILDFVGKVMGADLGRRFQRNVLGGGTIQTPGAFSKQLRLMLKDMDIDLAEKLLIEALTSENSKDFSVLLRRIDTPESAEVFDRYVTSAIIALATKYSLPFPYTDDLGNMEGEELLGNVPENEADITLK